MTHKQRITLTRQDDRELFDGRLYIAIVDWIYREVRNIRSISQDVELGEIDTPKGSVPVYRHSHELLWWINHGVYQDLSKAA